MDRSTGKAEALPGHKRVLVRQVVRALPVRSLVPLERALALTQDRVLAEVHSLVSVELESHDIKAAIFRPYMPLFAARDDGLSGVRLPEWLVDNLWKALETHEPRLFAMAQAAMRGLSHSDPVPAVFFELAEAAARLLRAHPQTVLPEASRTADEDVVLIFAAYLDIYHTAREALRRMPEWLGRLTKEKAVTIRVLFKDAGRLSEDGSVHLLEVVFGHLDDGADIMKFIGIVTNRASDRYVSQSELAGFGERLLVAAEASQAQALSLMRTNVLPEAAGHVLRALRLTQAVEAALDLSPGGPWMVRIARIRQSLAEPVEVRIGRLEGALRKALPEPGREDAAALAAALTLMGFLNEVRACAAAGGYAVALAQAEEAGEIWLGETLEGLLRQMHREDANEDEAFHQRVETLIQLTQALCGPEKANLARRRVASAQRPGPAKTVA